MAIEWIRMETVMCSLSAIIERLEELEKDNPRAKEIRVLIREAGSRRIEVFLT